MLFIRKYPLLTLVIVVLIGGGIWYRQFVVSVTKPVIVAATASDTPAPTPEPIQDNTFVYPALGITSPLTTLTDTDPFDSSDWGQFSAALDKGVGVSTTSSDLDSAHTLYIVGHSSTVKPTPYSFVFTGLGQAEIGQTFSFTANQKTYTYKVTDKKVLKPTNVSAFAALETPPTSPKQAILVTCWPVFTTTNRLVIVAEEVK